MCNFKKHPDDETDDEVSVSELDMLFVDRESSDESTTVDAEPVAGPSGTAVQSPVEFDTDSSDTSDNDSDSDKNNDDDSDDPDFVVEAFMKARTPVKKNPPDIALEDFVTDISFNPDRTEIAVGCITGDVLVYKYDIEGNTLLHTIENHPKACRAVEYSKSGEKIISCGKEKCIMLTDSSTCKLLGFYEDRDGSAPYSLYVLDENTFCCGDEGGVLKLYDMRQRQHVCRFKVGDDYISEMISNDDMKYLVCASGESLTAYDLNARTFYVQSEPCESELMSMKIMKYGKKLVVGTIKGKLIVFNWGEFGYHCDIFPGPKSCINTTVAITENILVTGCAGGILRAVSLYPHKHLGKVGQHKTSCDKSDISYDGAFIASAGVNNVVKFWDINYFQQVQVKAEKMKKKDTQNNLPSSREQNPGDFFAGLS